MSPTSVFSSPNRNTEAPQEWCKINENMVFVSYANGNAVGKFLAFGPSHAASHSEFSDQMLTLYFHPDIDEHSALAREAMPTVQSLMHTEPRVLGGGWMVLNASYQMMILYGVSMRFGREPRSEVTNRLRLLLPDWEIVSRE